MEKRSVSVIIPVHNCEKYLQFALESVLSQTFLPAEIFVVDDGSTDGTHQVARKFDAPVKLIQKSHSGVGDTLNRGIAAASAEYLAFLDADDLWVPDKLQFQMAALAKSGADLVFGYMQQFISPELTESERMGLECPPEPVPGYSRDTLLVKRETFLRVGLFEIHYRVGEFIEWYTRARDIGLKFFILPDVLAHRRVHTSNMTGQVATEKIDYTRIARASLARRRKSL